jgi:hypothetical protein
MQSAKSGVSRVSAYLPMWPHASGMPRAGCQALSRSDRDTVRRYGSGRIGYRAMYVRIGNLVVCSIDRT